jgi:hypothetical protein
MANQGRERMKIITDLNDKQRQLLQDLLDEGITFTVLQDRIQFCGTDGHAGALEIQLPSIPTEPGLFREAGSSWAAIDNLKNLLEYAVQHFEDNGYTLPSEWRALLNKAGLIKIKTVEVVEYNQRRY